MKSITGADLLTMRGKFEIASHFDDGSLVATIAAAKRYKDEVIWEQVTDVDTDGGDVVITVDGVQTAVRRYSYLVVREVA